MEFSESIKLQKSPKMGLSNANVKCDMSVWVSYKSLHLKPAVKCLLAILTAGQQWMIASQLPYWFVRRPRHPSAPAPACSCSFMQSGHNLPTAILSNGYHSFFPSSLAGAHQSPLGDESTANAHNHAAADEWQDQNLSDSKWFSRQC